MMNISSELHELLVVTHPMTSSAQNAAAVRDTANLLTDM